MKDSDMIDILNERINKVEKCIKETNDTDRVELDLYDLIAYSLVNNQLDNIEGNDYYSLLSALFEIKDENSNVSLHGNVFKAIINYFDNKKIPDELYEILVDLYFWNGKRNFLKKEMINGNTNKKEKSELLEKYNYIDNMINDSIDKITYLDEEYDYLESDFVYHLGK